MYTLLPAAAFTTAPSVPRCTLRKLPGCYCVLPALLQLLDRDLEVAEEQHQTALAAHLMVLDSLLDLQVRAGARVRETPCQAHNMLPHSYFTVACSALLQGRWDRLE